MPEGPLGAPRLTNIGPLSRKTRRELREEWERCPGGGKPEGICKEIKKASIAILEGQGIFAECEDLVDINSGNCFKVAERVAGQVDGVRVLQVGGGDHAWIEYNGTHYDAEVPSGVSSPGDLPIMSRVPKDRMLAHARMEAEMSGGPMPETFDDSIEDITPEIKDR